MTTDLDRAKYISFVSYRRDGSPVATPVWVVPFEGGYAFTTDSDSWKVKRILRDPRVIVRASGVRGKPKKGSVEHHARAEVLDQSRVDDVRAAVKAKYPIMYRLLIERSDRRAARAQGSASAGTAAIRFVLD